MTRHSAVVGATGAGKSTTVAGLLLALSDTKTYPSARIIVLDIHGEYSTALKDKATVFRVNANKSKGDMALCVPYWAMTYDELLPLTFGSLDDIGRGAILERITELKLASLNGKARSGVTEENLTVDSPVPFQHTQALV